MRHLTGTYPPDRGRTLGLRDNPGDLSKSSKPVPRSCRLRQAALATLLSDTAKIHAGQVLFLTRN
jgi:hypothetical protein